MKCNSMTEKEEIAKVIADNVRDGTWGEDFAQATCECLSIDYKLVEDSLKEECCG